jgi:hypothetical protein
MQAKDIPEEPIMRFIEARHPRWCNWFEGHEDSILQAMPPGTPPKVGLAKMRAMIRKGMIEGCGCGCRGDFRLPKREGVTPCQ